MAKERPSVRNKPTQNNVGYSSDETISMDLHSCNYVNKASLINLTSRVVNLSITKLTKNQISLLYKGITFVPSPKDPDISEILNDVNQFIRRLSLHLNFADEDTNNAENETIKPPETILKFRLKSNSTPKMNDDTFKALTSNIKRHLLESKIIKRTEEKSAY